MAAHNDNLRARQFKHSERARVLRNLNRGRMRRQVAEFRGTPRDFMQSRGGGGWKVARVHAVRR
jgi:hypothetical protein